MSRLFGLIYLLPALTANDASLSAGKKAQIAARSNVLFFRYHVFSNAIVASVTFSEEVVTGAMANVSQTRSYFDWGCANSMDSCRPNLLVELNDLIMEDCPRHDDFF